MPVTEALRGKQGLHIYITSCHLVTRNAVEAYLANQILPTHYCYGVFLLQGQKDLQEDQTRWQHLKFYRVYLIVTIVENSLIFSGLLTGLTVPSTKPHQLSKVAPLLWTAAVNLARLAGLSHG